MSNAAATLVGQNLGAEKPDRAEKSVWITAVFNMVVLMLIGAMLYLFAPDLVRLFTTDETVIQIGAQCLQVICFGYFFYSWGMIMVQAFNGSGDTTTPTLLNLICFWVLEIPLAYYLAMNLRYEEFGVFISIVIAESLLGILGVMMFRRGSWKLRKV
jgi:Na+-driven multidrug efflux pump